MGRNQKRKREEDAAEDSIDQPAAKVQVLGDEAPSAKKPGAGERRQKKSERRKKEKGERAKQNSKKRKEAAAAAAKVDNKDDLATGEDFVSLGGGEGRKLKEKRRSPRAIRKERRLQQQQEQQQEEGVEATTSKGKGKKSKKQKAEPTEDAGSDSRFICFVGNLPYTATTEQIQAHFAKLEPQSIRLSTDKQTGKCKGFAFLEFDNFDRMKTCLKRYHHSIFDPDAAASGDEPQQTSGDDPKSKGRKINVELTAGGGGGKSAGRKDKIKKKNLKLDEERARDWDKKRQQQQGEAGKNRDGQPGSAEGAIDSRGDIHPSRLSRVQM